MTTQLSIFDALRAPPIIRPVDPDGHVLQGQARYTFALPHKRLAGDSCCIELHPAGEGLWMWSTGFSTDDGCGCSYKVGEKWGHFAASPDDALHYAREELKKRLAAQRGARKGVTRILAWADALTLENGNAR
jgi:hypothetical protein